MAKRTQQHDELFADPPAEEIFSTPQESAEAAETAEGFFDEPAGHVSKPYIVVARRYRPQTFSQIVGQENVRNVLSDAIRSGDIAHAYLFSGPRGTGKTSTARILAKAVNCLNGGPRPDPCGKCPSCQSIAAGTSLDVIEIDAASNTGVDNIRDLRSGVALSPFSRFKVYIVDEVHMLSTQAFNALLKTLEEPPPQVIFVLATTELQKVPETIVSRCQAFNFRRFTTIEIADQLDRIFERELADRNISTDKATRRQVVEMIAQNAEGGMRDAQVALDQVLVLCRDGIDAEAIQHFLGSVEPVAIDAFIASLHDRETEKLLREVQSQVEQGQELERIVKAVVEALRDLLILKSSSPDAGLVSAAPDRLRQMAKLASEFPFSFLLNASQALLKLHEQMKTSPQPRFLLEMEIMRLTRIDAVEDVSQLLQRLEQLERQLGSGGGGLSQASPPATAPVRPAAAPAPTPTRKHAAADRLESSPEPRSSASDAAPIIMEAPSEFSDAPAKGGQIIEALREKAMLAHHYLYISLLESQLLDYNGRTLTLGVDGNDKFTLEYLGKQSNVAVLRTLLRELTGQEVQVKVVPVEPRQPAIVPVDAAQPPAAAAAPPAQPEPLMPDVPEATDTQDDQPYYPPELLEQAKRVYKGAALMDVAGKNEDLKDLVEKIKQAFDIDESRISFRTL